MKSFFSSRRIVITLFIVIAIVLVACERQLDQEGDATSTPAAPVLTQPTLAPTTDPALAPTTDPALAPTTDPALAPAVDPAAQATAVPGTNVEVTPPTTTQTTHVVAAGETLFSIALQYGVTVVELATANNLDPNGVLSPGQVLTVPVSGTAAQPQPTVGAQPTTTAGEQVHVVAAGENLFRISLRYGFTVAELAAYNNIPNPDYIYEGQVILIPPGGNP